ncbi:MAG: amidohydrolase [Cyclobacteriaceae bacterium]
MMKSYSEKTKMTRRGALKGVAGVGLLGLGFSQGWTNISTPQKVPVIEWNAHIFSPDTSKYPIHPKATYTPDVSVHPSDPLAAYMKRLKKEGINRAVIVHPEPYGDDHSLIVDSLKREPQNLRGTSLFYPKDPEAPQKLETLVKAVPHIVSTRFHAHRGKESYIDSFSDQGARALWKKAVDLDLVVELHIGPSYAAQAGKLIKEFKGCKVLIDHLAEPHLGSSVEFADVLELAKYPNVFMKLSGIGHFAKDEPYYESAMPFTSRVIREFGPDRMVWGSGSPKIVDVHMADYSASDRAKVKGGNIQQLLDWD